MVPEQERPCCLQHRLCLLLPAQVKPACRDVQERREQRQRNGRYRQVHPFQILTLQESIGQQGQEEVQLLVPAQPTQAQEAWTPHRVEHLQHSISILRLEKGLEALKHRLDIFGAAEPGSDVECLFQEKSPPYQGKQVAGSGQV